MNDLAKMASDCMSLSYRYNNIMDCVKYQRPQLLKDPVLTMIMHQYNYAEQAFKNRIEELAQEYYEEKGNEERYPSPS